MMKVERIGLLCLNLILLVALFIRTGEAEFNSFLINCGTNSTANVDDRKWVGDSATGNNITLSSLAVEASTTTYTGDSLYSPLYTTARFFRDSLNYTFQAAEGKYFLRLHFYPFSLMNYNVNDSSFAIDVNGLKLALELNVPGEILKKNLVLESSGANYSLSSLVKEFFLTVEDSVIVVQFIPRIGSFGFVNAIEIVPVADHVFEELVSKVGAKESSSSLDLSKHGFETMYRLNVGGPVITPNQDLSLRRSWEVDWSYMITANAGLEISSRANITYGSPNDTSVAPLLLYRTAREMSNTEVVEMRFNMSWKFEVDPGFDYLVRLHFCELVFDRASHRTFRIYINNQTAADNFDVFVRAGGMNKAYHQDYFDATSSNTNTLWIQLGPDTTAGSAGTDALLNGLEIFKLSRNGNLAHVEKYPNQENGKKSNALILWVAIGVGITSIIILASLIILVVWICKKRQNKQSDTKKKSPVWRPLFLVNSTVNAKAVQNPNGSSAGRTGKRFTFAEIKAATSNFDDSLIIGVGGFGKVYKGDLEDGTLCAIKRANPQSQQGLAEFETEIEMLSKLRHRHLVSLIGFCDEQNEMILVYEYMSNGTLRSHLFGSNLPPLSWKTRIEACIGAARGLHYLHTGAERGIIHRDVKTTNILLDEDFVAKMSDFGLSKTGPALEHTHVSTAVKGSFGYLDPEYFRRQQLTEKSDVYSFGVVLFEVVCARAVINPSLPRDQINLAEWVMKYQRQGSLETIIDPFLNGKYSKESLIKFAEIAEKCLADEGKSRPTMGEVLWHLEYVLQVQVAWLQPSDDDEEACLDTRVEENCIAMSELAEPEPVANRPGEFAVEVNEFSQLVNQQGR